MSEKMKWVSLPVEDGKVGEKVGEFEPWMAEYLNPWTPGLDARTIAPLSLSYKEYKEKTGFDLGFEPWLKSCIARAIARLFEEDGYG